MRTQLTSGIPSCLPAHPAPSRPTQLPSSMPVCLPGYPVAFRRTHLPSGIPSYFPAYPVAFRHTQLPSGLSSCLQAYCDGKHNEHTPTAPTYQKVCQNNKSAILVILWYVI